MKTKKLVEILCVCILIVLGILIFYDRDIRSTFQGTFENEVYINEFADLTFTLPENWSYATDEEMENILGKSDSDVTYSMMAQNIYTGSNVIFMIMDCGGYSERLMFELLKGREKEDTSYSDIYKVLIGNKEYSTINCNDEMLQSYYLREIDGYMACLIVTADSNDESVDSIISNFK